MRLNCYQVVAMYSSVSSSFDMLDCCFSAGVVAAGASLIGATVPFVRWISKKSTAKGYTKEQVEKLVDETDFKTADKKLVAKLGRATGEGYLVVGGGQVGCSIIDHLLMRGEEHVVLFDLREVERYEGNNKVIFVRGDMTNKDDVRRAFKAASTPITTLFHTAALISFNHRLTWQYNLSHRINVVGTQNLLDVSLESGCRYFIQTSTSHVLLQVDAPNTHLPDDAPYTRGGVSHYATSKAEAEKRVLATNAKKNSDGFPMLTGSVRPCSAVFGAGDRLYVGPAIRNKESQVMGPWATVDHVYVENVSYGHIRMEQKLREESEGKMGAGQAAGRAFNITNGQPFTFKEFHDVFKGFFPSLRIVNPPLPILQVLARLSELAQFVGASLGGDLDRLTPPVILAQVTDYTFDDSQAVKILGYEPIYSTWEGLQKTVHYELKNNRQ